MNVIIPVDSISPNDYFTMRTNYAKIKFDNDSDFDLLIVFLYNGTNAVLIDQINRKTMQEYFWSIDIPLDFYLSGTVANSDITSPTYPITRNANQYEIKTVDSHRVQVTNFFFTTKFKKYY
jgi:hypothetical protein